MHTFQNRTLAFRRSVFTDIFSRTFEHKRFAACRIEQRVDFGVRAQFGVAAFRARRLLRRRLLAGTLASAVIVVVRRARRARPVQSLKTDGKIRVYDQRKRREIDGRKTRENNRCLWWRVRITIVIFKKFRIKHLGGGDKCRKRIAFV